MEAVSRCPMDQHSSFAGSRPPARREPKGDPGPSGPPGPPPPQATPPPAPPASRSQPDESPDPIGRVRNGYLHIGPDWRITFAHLEGGTANERTGPELQGRVLWELYPEVLGTPFEEQYRATMRDRKPRTFEAVYGPAKLRLANHLFPAGDGIALYYEDVTRRRQLETQLDRRSRQQEAVARLGQAAAEGVDMPTLLDKAVRETASALDVEFTKIVEPTGDGQTLVLRAGVGWRDGLVGSATVSAEGGSQAAYAIQAHGPVIVDDIMAETRFSAPPLFVEHGIVSGLSVLVGPRDAPYGVLGAHSRRRRTFTQDDINFMQAVANLLGAAIARTRIEAELRRHRANLEGLVQERTRLLEASNRELEAFSYTVSHDLRTPLRAIDGFSQILVRQHGELLPPSAKEILSKVQDNARRMGHLIENLLSLSRLGRKQMTVKTVDLGAIADQVLAQLSAGAPDRQVTPTIDTGLLVQGDPELLRVFMENLLGNAWKFSSGRSRARIEVGRLAGAAEPTFFVRDNGAGFDMAHAHNLFQPFHRLHSPSEFEGTGVGLASVQRIAQRHGGRVWAEAKPGKGATFWFTLPAGQAPPADKAA
jgi:signal transduction histidine kinase